MCKQKNNVCWARGKRRRHKSQKHWKPTQITKTLGTPVFPNMQNLKTLVLQQFTVADAQKIWHSNQHSENVKHHTTGDSRTSKHEVHPSTSTIPPQPCMSRDQWNRQKQQETAENLRRGKWQKNTCGVSGKGIASGASKTTACCATSVALDAPVAFWIPNTKFEQQNSSGGDQPTEHEGSSTGLTKDEWEDEKDLVNPLRTSASHLVVWCLAEMRPRTERGNGDWETLERNPSLDRKRRQYQKLRESESALTTVALKGLP